MNTQQDFHAAAKETVAVGLGYVPLGIAFGLFAVSQGFHWWWATLTALIVYSGSMEFVAVGLIMSGATMLNTAITTFFVSFRHAFYGLSYPMDNVPRAAKPYAVHALTDEAFAILSHPRARRHSGGRIIWIQILCQLYWVAGVTLGALVGESIPWDLSWMGFTLTALFVVLAIDVLKVVPHPVPLATVAFILAVMAQLLVPDRMMAVSMSVFAVVVILGKRWLG